MESPGLRGGLSRDQSFYSGKNASPLFRDFKLAVAKDFKEESFHKIKRKFWIKTLELRKEGFHIS